MAVETTPLYCATPDDCRVNLKFDTGRHRYSVEVDGKETFVPSVTGITGIIDKSGPLMWWAVNQAIEVARKGLVAGVSLDEVQILRLLERMRGAHRKKSQQAADVGHLVHAWIEEHISALLNKTAQPAEPVNPAVRSGVNAFLSWEAANSVEYVFTERKVFSIKHQYSGTADIVAMVNGELCIVDIKTTNATRDGKARDEHKLQTAGYQIALEEEFEDKFDNRHILRLDKEDGSFDPHNLNQEGPGFDTDRDGFLHARGLYRRLKAA